MVMAWWCHQGGWLEKRQRWPSGAIIIRRGRSCHHQQRKEKWPEYYSCWWLCLHFLLLSPLPFHSSIHWCSWQIQILLHIQEICRILWFPVEWVFIWWCFPRVEGVEMAMTTDTKHCKPPPNTGSLAAEKLPQEKASTFSLPIWLTST